MREKSISSHLNIEMDAFIKGIDKKQREDVYRNCLITGGCIVSMVNYNKKEDGDLFDHINDYDLYFTDKKILLNTIQYYLNKFHNTHASGYAVTKKYKYPELKIEFKNSFGEDYSEEEYYSDDTGKIYLYINVPDNLKQDIEEDYHKIFKDSTGIKYISNHAITLKNKFQLIARFCGPVDFIHSNFDFEHTKGYFIPTTGEVKIPEKTYRAIKEKRLVYQGSKYPLASIFRMNKFQSRGWRIDRLSVIKMIFQINRLDLTNKHFLLDQLIGFYQDRIDIILNRLENIDDIFSEIELVLNEEINNKRYGIENSEYFEDFKKENEDIPDWANK